MWRLWNKLFGWHYVLVEGYENSIHIKRVFRPIPNFWCVEFSNRVLQLHAAGYAVPTLSDKHVTDYRKYIPLTFKPEELA